MSSLPVFILHEDHDKSCEYINSVEVNAHGLVNGIISWLQLSTVDDFLDVIEDKGAEQ